MTTKNKVEIERLSHSDNLGRLRQKKHQHITAP